MPESANTATVIIDRQSWGRGSEEGGYLYAGWRNGGKFCVFGAALRQAGVSPEIMDGMKMPQLLAQEGIDLPQWAHEMLGQDEAWIDEVIDLNDSDSFTQAQRERELSERFSEVEIKLEFIN